MISHLVFTRVNRMTLFPSSSSIRWCMIRVYPAVGSVLFARLSVSLAKMDTCPQWVLQLGEQ